MNKKKFRRRLKFLASVIGILVLGFVWVTSFPRPLAPKSGPEIPPPAHIAELMVVTNTPGPEPKPQQLDIEDLKNYAADQGRDMFFLFTDCTKSGKIPKIFRSNIVFTDGQFSVVLNLSDVEIGCSYHKRYAAITTDDMSSEGWTEIAGLWISP